MMRLSEKVATVRRHRRSFIGVVLSAGFVMAAASAARAEQFTITGGTAFGDDSSATMTVMGDAFRFTLFGETTGEISNLGHVFCPHPCDPTGVTLTGSMNGFLGAGTALVEGTLYTDVDFHGSMSFTGGPTTIDSGNPGLIRVEGPFEFTALFNGFRDGAPLFSHTLTGQGRGLLRIFSTDTGGSLLSTELDFTAGQHAPVPEPATWLLVATGAGIAARRRRRASRSAADGGTP